MRRSAEPLVIGFPHPPQAIGGPGSFQIRFTRYLLDHGHEATYPGAGRWPDAVLVVGGTRRLPWLWRCRRRGIPIIHRLGPRNWRHRHPSIGRPRPLVSVARNLLLEAIRRWLADRVVYQSEFSREWWNRDAGPAPCPETVIPNGVDLQRFAPDEDRVPPEAGEAVLVSIEGEVPSDPAALAILETVGRELVAGGQVGEARIYGRLPDRGLPLERMENLRFLSAIPRHEVPGALSEADVFLSLDINGACPNAVIEALAAGVPVVAFDSGALRELVPEHAGVVLPYGADPWRLQPPATGALAKGVRTILDDLPVYRKGARRAAETRHGMERIGERYLNEVRAAIGRET